MQNIIHHEQMEFIQYSKSVNVIYFIKRLIKIIQYYPSMQKKIFEKNQHPSMLKKETL